MGAARPGPRESSGSSLGPARWPRPQGLWEPAIMETGKASGWQPRDSWSEVQGGRLSGPALEFRPVLRGPYLSEARCPVVTWVLPWTWRQVQVDSLAYRWLRIQEATCPMTAQGPSPRTCLGSSRRTMLPRSRFSPAEAEPGSPARKLSPPGPRRARTPVSLRRANARPRATEVEFLRSPSVQLKNSRAFLYLTP